MHLFKLYCYRVNILQLPGRRVTQVTDAQLFLEQRNVDTIVTNAMKQVDACPLGLVVGSARVVVSTTVVVSKAK